TELFYFHIMNKIAKLKTCDWSLLLLAAGIFTSGIYLEITHSSGLAAVWIHIALGILFFISVAYHIFLHFGKSNWFERFHKLKSQFTRVLWWISLATLITGIISCVHRFITLSHSPIGGIHGKIGFLMILLCIGHICKRIKFFKSRR
ncbi:MAG: TMEM134 family protein, partial [Muribaculaceae bacterium]|nr:TMEM134 family protein [Muribaculaceae bacterium]